MAIDYEAKKEQEAARNAAKSKKARDIAPLPKVKNKRRKAACRNDLVLFCKTYQPQLYSITWSEDQENAARALELSILEGLLQAYAMPRGTGKTTIAESATEWASLYGHRLFTMTIGATKDLAVQILESIKGELATNELLHEDFPEVCHAVRRLEGLSNRCKGQLFEGKETGIEWGADEIVLPTIPGSPASGVVIRVAGLTGAIRGAKHKRRDGKSVRPDQAILDDPQTDESARSVSQTAQRLRIIKGAVLGLAGPKKKIAAVCPCTVICRGDLADTLLDREKHPEWNGIRTKMVYDWPAEAGLKLWDQYRQIRNEALRSEDRTAKAATAFYRKNRKAMDDGAKVAWPQRFNDDELSALQHAFNLKFRDEAAFDAEMQQEPHEEKLDNAIELTVDGVLARSNGLERGKVPAEANTLVGFVDVHEKVLFWSVYAFADDFTGFCVDYGAYPEQDRAHFALHDARRTLADVAKEAKQGEVSLEAALHFGLEQVTERICGQEWTREDTATMRVKLALVDSGWKSDVVSPFCRRSKYAAQLLPSKGRGFGAKDVPLIYLKRKPGERRGNGVPWRILPQLEGSPIRRAEFDANFWKSFIAARLAIPLGGRESLTLFGNADRAGQHQLYAEHLSSEYAIRVEARGQKIDEWQLRPNRENHWFDTAVGCHVAASIEGVVLGRPAAPPKRPKKPRDYATYIQI